MSKYFTRRRHDHRKIRVRITLDIEKFKVFFKAATTVKEKLRILRIYAKKKYLEGRPDNLRKKRKAFRKKKYKVALKFCEVCDKKKRLLRHHVIQLQHGGLNALFNVVVLCKGCHKEIHPWLKRGNGNGI